MTLAALVLLLAVPRSGPVPQTGDAQKAATSAVSTETSSADDSGAKPASATASASVSDTPVVPAATNESLSASNLLPSVPEPKAAPSAAAGVPAAFPVAPVKAPVVVYSETPAQRKVWYTLAIVGHSAAAFDAWSTRRAISGGYGTEANPLLRPFAHSGALYVATQVSPALMDFLGKRMMTSRHAMFRKLWWLPQTAGAGLSFAAGSHNVALTQ